MEHGVCLKTDKEHETVWLPKWLQSCRSKLHPQAPRLVTGVVYKSQSRVPCIVIRTLWFLLVYAHWSDSIKTPNPWNPVYYLQEVVGAYRQNSNSLRYEQLLIRQWIQLPFQKQTLSSTRRRQIPQLSLSTSEVKGVEIALSLRYVMLSCQFTLTMNWFQLFKILYITYTSSSSSFFLLLLPRKHTVAAILYICLLRRRK